MYSFGDNYVTTCTLTGATKIKDADGRIELNSTDVKRNDCSDTKEYSKKADKYNIDGPPKVRYCRLPFAGTMASELRIVLQQLYRTPTTREV